MTPINIALGAAAALAVLFAVLYFVAKSNAGKTRVELKTACSDRDGLKAERDALKARYAKVIDVDAEAAKLKAEIASLETNKAAFLTEDASRRDELTKQYTVAKALYENLQAEVRLLEENLEDMSFGLYKPHYTFETSEQFKAEFDRIYEQKKAMIRAGSAAVCATEWTVNNSKREGAKMTKQNTKVMLRAFNGEVDAAVAKVTWNNVTKMEERIRKAYDAINETGTANQISIKPGYLDLALAELRLTHEYEDKKRQEKEEQRQIREQMRDEERARREFEKAQAEAAAEETRYEKALEKARADVEKAKGAEIDKINAKVADLEAKLKEAHEKMQRAKSMAELTKSGNVYIISNIGSFGEGMLKIGMTRRLDPQERVDELSDASVPFDFDVHAMIYSEDAPGLENAFHRHFADRRVNLVNLRREFFNVSLAEVKAFATTKGLDLQLTMLAEAREFRESLALREEAKKAAQAVVAKPAPTSTVVAPEDLFGATQKPAEA